MRILFYIKRLSFNTLDCERFSPLKINSKSNQIPYTLQGSLVFSKVCTIKVLQLIIYGPKL